MAIKIFCDFCGEEIKDENNLGVVVIYSHKTSVGKQGELVKVPIENKFHLCGDCFAKFEEQFNKLKKDGKQ